MHDALTQPVNNRTKRKGNDDIKTASTQKCERAVAIPQYRKMYTGVKSDENY
jgi:hypothetical protein